MDEEERAHYTKLLTFTFGISLNVLHLYFEMKILDKEEFFFFLDRCKHVLFHALHPTVSCCECRNGSIPLSTKPPTLYPDQYNLLFNIENSKLQCLHNKTVKHCLCKYSASRSVEVDSLDISLVYAIVKTCCPSIHGNPQWIKDVKDTRNFLAHKSNCRLTKDEYDTRLNTVENATLDLAKVVSSTFLKMIQKQISDFKKDVLSSNTVKEILASSNDGVCKRLESLMKKVELVNEESKSMSREIIDHIKKCKDELSIDINELIFEVKTNICEQLPSQKIAEESVETRCATSTPQTAQPQCTQSKNENKCIVEWKLATPDTWNVSEMKDTLQKFSCLFKPCFEIEFVYIGSLVIRTIVPEHRLSNYDDFKSAVRSFLAKIVEVCQLDTDTPTVVKVDLNIFTEIPPTEISTNVNKENKKSTLTSLCHYCKEELVCDNCTTNGRIKLPVSLKKWSSESALLSMPITSRGLSDSESFSSVSPSMAAPSGRLSDTASISSDYFLQRVIDEVQMEESMQKEDMEKRLDYNPITWKSIMESGEYSPGQMKRSMPKGHMEKSMPKGKMVKSIPKGQMEKSMSKGYKRERINYITTPVSPYTSRHLSDSDSISSVSPSMSHTMRCHSDADSISSVSPWMSHTMTRLSDSETISRDSDWMSVSPSMSHTLTRLSDSETISPDSDWMSHTMRRLSDAASISSVSPSMSHTLTRLSDSETISPVSPSELIAIRGLSDSETISPDYFLQRDIDEVQMVESMQKEDMEKRLDYNPITWKSSTESGEYSPGQMTRSMPKGHMRKSMPKGHMERSIPKGQTVKSMSKGYKRQRTDDIPTPVSPSMSHPMIRLSDAASISSDDTRRHEQLRTRDFRTIRLEHDTKVPKSSDILPRCDMKDKDESKSSTEKH